MTENPSDVYLEDEEVPETFEEETEPSADPGSQVSGARGRRRPGKRGRKPSKVDVKVKLERSRQSARECRARKKLRYQYLEELISSREKAIFALREELEQVKGICVDLDKGSVKPDCLEFLKKEGLSNKLRKEPDKEKTSGKEVQGKENKTKSRRRTTSASFTVTLATRDDKSPNQDPCDHVDHDVSESSTRARRRTTSNCEVIDSAKLTEERYSSGEVPAGHKTKERSPEGLQFRGREVMKRRGAASRSQSLPLAFLSDDKCDTGTEPPITSPTSITMPYSTTRKAVTHNLPSATISSPPESTAPVDPVVIQEASDIRYIVPGAESFPPPDVHIERPPPEPAAALGSNQPVPSGPQYGTINFDDLNSLPLTDFIATYLTEDSS